EAVARLPGRRRGDGERAAAGGADVDGVRACRVVRGAGDAGEGEIGRGHDVEHAARRAGEAAARRVEAEAGAGLVDREAGKGGDARDRAHRATAGERPARAAGVL